MSPVGVLNCPSKPVYLGQSWESLSRRCNISVLPLWPLCIQLLRCGEIGSSQTTDGALHLFLIISGIGSAAVDEVRGQRLWLLLAHYSSHTLHYLPEAKTLFCCVSSPLQSEELCS